MLSTIYVEKRNGVTIKKIYNELKKYHKKNYFIKIAPLNKNLGTENVLNTNFCEISVCTLKNKNKLLILSAIDNLVKGAAGQAVQNMNVIFGYKENLGLA
jgi:N-acetyl-gamma-glutamyl-phosphate reductase